MRKYLVRFAIVAAVLEASAGQSLAHEFAEFSVLIYSGHVSAPDFKHSAKKFRNFRTVLREGAAQGVNYGGHYAVITIGCGTNCSFTMVVDVKNGRIFDFPLGGEDYYNLNLHFRSESRLIKAQWGGGDNDDCHKQEFVLAGAKFESLGTSRSPGRCPEY